MPKPIFIVKVQANLVNELQLAQIRQQLKNTIGDEYYILVVPVKELKESFEFQTFYEKDFTEIKYEELKQMINDALI